MLDTITHVAAFDWAALHSTTLGSISAPGWISTLAFAPAEAGGASGGAAGAGGEGGAIAPLWSVKSAIALLTLTAMEIVLGIDNIVFIAILTGKLPEAQRPFARRLGIAMAAITRVLLLLAITWIMGLSKTALFTLPLVDHEVTGRDLVLLIGGLFLIGKATKEIHAKVEGGHEGHAAKVAPSLAAVVAQIMLIDIVFSLDSVITAVGMAQHVEVMVAAVLISVGVMLAFAGPVARFVEKHPTVKMLALSFLLLIGVVLVADGIGEHINKGYIYFAMAFSVLVEMLNLLVKRRNERRRGGGHGEAGTGAGGTGAGGAHGGIGGIGGITGPGPSLEQGGEPAR